MDLISKVVLGVLLAIILGLAIFGGYEAYTKAVIKTDLVSCTDKNAQLTSTNEDWKIQTGVADAATAKLQLDGLKREADAANDQKQAALNAAPLTMDAKNLSILKVNNLPAQDISECAAMQQLEDAFYGVRK